jgi:hypothetical protein
MNLGERVKAILLTPDSEWSVIEREPGDAAYLFTNYVAILAAIPAVCGLIGMVLHHVGFFYAVLFAVVYYVLGFVVVYLMAIIIDGLAPTFSGQKNFGNALKVAAYFPTPYWLAGVFSLVPALGFLRILGLYGIYLLYKGLPLLMRSPQDKAFGYSAVVIIAAIVIGFVVFTFLIASILSALLR